MSQFININAAYQFGQKGRMSACIIMNMAFQVKIRMGSIAEGIERDSSQDHGNFGILNSILGLRNRLLPSYDFLGKCLLWLWTHLGYRSLSRLGIEC